jgi:hypothetical protein
VASLPTGRCKCVDIDRLMDHPALSPRLESEDLFLEDLAVRTNDVGRT